MELETDVTAQLAGEADGHDPVGNDEDVAALQAAILDKLTYHVGKRRAIATERDWLMATAYALRDQIVDRWLAGVDAAYQNGAKRVYYLSLEFLIGRLLFDNLNNLNTLDTMRAALAGLDVDLDKLRALEPDAALGNGGLGRLAACFMESMATLDIPAHGYGIRYEHGLFRQVMKNGWQQEFPEDWLALGNPWEFYRPEVAYEIGFGGSIEAVAISEAAVRHVWHPAETIEAVAYDTPSVGWRGRRVNTLRLWSARSADPLRLDAFNHGDHAGALAEQVKAEVNIQGAVPVRRHPGRPGIAPAPGVFLRFGLAAGPRAPPHQGVRAYRQPGRQDRHPVERHPSRDRRRRTDAHPARCPPYPLGGRLAHDAGNLQLHQPHSAARGAGKLAGSADGASAAAPHADHLSHQRPAPRLRAEGTSR